MGLGIFSDVCVWPAPNVPPVLVADRQTLRRLSIAVHDINGLRKLVASLEEGRWHELCYCVHKPMDAYSDLNGFIDFIQREDEVLKGLLDRNQNREYYLWKTWKHYYHFNGLQFVGKPIFVITRAGTCPVPDALSLPSGAASATMQKYTLMRVPNVL